MNELAVYENKTAEEKRYIVFNVGKEIYGIDVTCVNTIIQMPIITRVPSAPNCFSGIINLRGEIISVMSLNKRLNSNMDTFTKDTRVIILDLGNGSLMGVIVDGVREVMIIDETDIEDPSPFLKEGESLVRGVAKKGDELISILEVTALIKREIA
ncbi:MAG: purine-binding chemotaxis protein CheW [Butyrivibrio sp.]|nr:purine-binding chemotaxis protein CheW [Butyrivibrio sp.]